MGLVIDEKIYSWKKKKRISLSLGHRFSGSYDEYFGLATDTDSFNYLQLANYVSQKFFPESITIAEVLKRSFEKISLLNLFNRKFPVCQHYVDHLLKVVLDLIIV
jgi:hypothetical protein